MPLTFYAPVLFVKNIELSKSFYMNILEQEIEYDFGKNVIFRSRVSLWEISTDSEIDEVKGSSVDGNTFELYFETEDIEGAVHRFMSQNIEFLHHLKTEPWGQKTFRFFDPDHHLIEIGESMNTFVHRIFQETGSLKATAQKTGISEAVIPTILKRESIE